MASALVAKQLFGHAINGRYAVHSGKPCVAAPVVSLRMPGVRSQNLAWDFTDRYVRDSLFCFVLEWSIQLPFVSLSYPRSPHHHNGAAAQEPPTDLHACTCNGMVGATRQ